MIRRFIAWLFGMPLVALRDFDGEVVLRLGRKSYFGEFYANRMPFKIRQVWLCPGGVIKPDCYVKEWAMVRDYRRDSGRLPQGEDSRSEAECEASQSGPKGIARNSSSENPNELA